MENDKKVFCSEITRIDFKENNNLFELLNVTPVKPVPVDNTNDETLLRHFEPIREKNYVPKKRSWLKVRTVREIRKQFEQDNLCFVIEDMEKQQNTLLSKIRAGSVSDYSTKVMAKKLLNADHPISRTAWQMLNNINPEKHVNPTQFVLWNGKRIRVTGSKGGKNRFMCNYDLGKKTLECKRVNRFDRKGKVKKRSGLLRDSLSIKFKPGPLQKKAYLDDSHQKYHMGSPELVKLPKPALVIQPAYGTVLEPIITSFLYELRAEDGSINKEWAEFAVSVLGRVQNKSLVDLDKQNCVTFDLSYKCGQNRLLMRRDIELETSNHDNKSNGKSISEKDNMSDIKKVMNNILASVEISLKQDEFYSIEDELLPTSPEQFKDLSITNIKEKNKKKYGELDRLDVTIIQLPGTPKQIYSKPCGKSYCNLGCICDSLACTYKFKQHCGLVECMLGCKCEFSKYKDIELMENGCAELIPGLMKLDTELNRNLAKEEQKFHQTVLVSGEKSIVLKSSKRNLKSSKKYAEFYSNMRLKIVPEPKKILTVVDKKLNNINIEPWCMVHNLYKCFCKGRFLETSAFNAISTQNTKDYEIGDHNKVEKSGDIRIALRPRARHKDSNVNNLSFSLIDGEVLKDHSQDNLPDTCARTTKYEGRKYEDKYYKITNHKILEMEKNDTQLRNKILRIMSTSETDDEPYANTLRNSPDNSTVSTDVCVESEHNDNENKNVNVNVNMPKIRINRDTAEPKSKITLVQPVLSDNIKESRLSDKVSWKFSNRFKRDCHLDEATRTKIIEQEFPKSFEILKQNFLRGKKITLEGPTKGKVIIHSWEFVLSRYRLKKNIFMVTKSSQHRIFMAVDDTHSFFQTCVNIDTIKFADLHEYPFVVKYLLTNAISKDHFCILLGWEFCWEIIASVMKNSSGFEPDELVNRPSVLNNEEVSDDSVCNDNWRINDDDNVLLNNPSMKHSDTKNESGMDNSERSKWFIMSIETDFPEIHCHKAGFYVKREQIIAAIELARTTKKTVVINKPKEETSFGFYAMPNTKEYSIMVGPYSTDASLGFKAICTDSSNTQKRIKGYWLSTNKVDNEKILKDPLSFISPKSVSNDRTKTMHKTTPKNKTSNISYTNALPSTSETILKTHDHLNKNKTSDIGYTNAFPSTLETLLETHDHLNKNEQGKKVKVVKPIKILRTNGFYHLTSNKRIVRKISPNYGKSFVSAKRLKKNPISIDDPKSLLNITKYSDEKIINSTEEANAAIEYTEPATDVSQIKITSVYSESETPQGNKDEIMKTGMLILKPEEINKKLYDCNFNSNDLVDDNEMVEMSMDIDNFLSSGARSTWENDVLFISDEENDDTVGGNNSHIWEYVWIQCSNIKNLGWIRGKRKENMLLSIDLPGFKHIKCFEENEALNEINRILSNKVHIPQHIKLEWKVCTLADQQLIGDEIKLQHLTKDYVITENGIQKLCQLDTDSIKNNEIDNQTTFQLFGDLNKTSDLMEGLEETSRLLDDESTRLWNETERRSSDIIHTITVPEELRLEMTETLQDLMTMNNNLEDE